MPTTTVIPDVELVRVGTWDASTGRTSITTADLESMVAAYNDHQVDRAPVKIGHTDARFKTRDGDPAYGWVENLRVSPDGKSLRGDLAGVPSKLAEIMPAAFRRRSVEISWGVRTAASKVYRAALVGLALLGVQAPAVKGMADILALYADGVTVEGTNTVEFGDTPPIPPAPNTPPDGGASTSTEGDTTVPKKIREQLGLAADATDEQVEQAVTAALAARTTAETTAATATAALSAEQTARTTAETALAAATAAQTALAAGDTVVITSAQFAALQSGAQAGIAALAAMDGSRRDGIIATAFAAGRIHTNDRAKFRALLDTDETAVTALLTSLTPLFPVTELGSDTPGHTSGAELTAADYAAADRAFGLEGI